MTYAGSPNPDQPSQPPPPAHAPQPRPTFPQYGYGVPPQGQMAQYGAPNPALHPGWRPAVAPDGRPLAEFTDRFLAKLIDVAILSGVSMLIMVPAFIAIFAMIMSSVDSGSEGPTAAMVLGIFAIYGALFLLSFVIAYVYYVELTLRKGGQSYGKRAMKIVVVPMKPGVTLTRGILARRWLVDTVAPAFIPMFQWINGLWQLWDQPYRQCLHDKFADTVVVKVSA